MAQPQQAPGAGAEDGVRRRDFINIAAGAFVAGGAAMAIWPFIQQMNPSADVLALATTEVDLAPITTGMAIKVMWQGKPVFVRNRTSQDIKAARATPLGELRDPQLDQDRVKSGKDNWLIVSGVCTHLGCIPLGTKEGEVRGDYNGWYCPCHGSHYDTSGRIRKGPAPKNLAVPPYEFTSDTKILIG